MNNAQLLLVVNLIQQVLFGLLWAGMAYMRVSRQPALHWATTAALAGGGMALAALRGQLPVWLSVGVGNLLVLMSFIMLRRGVQRVAQQRPSDREHLTVLVLGVACTVPLVLQPDSLLQVVVMAALLLNWTLWRAAADVYGGLRAEFGRRAAWWCALPLLLQGAVFLYRGGVALLDPSVLVRYASEPGGGKMGPPLVSLVFSLLIQANLLAMVLLRLVRRLQHQSDHDALTGLLIRRPMASRLQAESQRLRRHGTSFALMAIDIDHFKRVNDRYGHDVGDAVLKRVARELAAAAREMDSVARMGGEEFSVLLPATDLPGAERVAQRMLQQVQALQHPEADEQLCVTISIGLAAPSHGGESIQALQRRLDQALYCAKAAGRNCIRHAQWPQDAPPTTASAAGHSERISPGVSELGAL